MLIWTFDMFLQMSSTYKCLKFPAASQWIHINPLLTAGTGKDGFIKNRGQAVEPACECLAFIGLLFLSSTVEWLARLMATE
jgi:hypothetical protein